MNLFKTLSILFFINSNLFLTNSLTHFMSSKKAEVVKDPNNSKATIFRADLLACGTNDCQKLKQFDISENEFGCKNNFLPITVSIKLLNGSLVKKDVFLGESNIVAEAQEVKPFCSKIKRYYVNAAQKLIQMYDTLSLVDNENVESFIKNELLKNLDFIHYVLFVFNLYDEKTDTVQFIKSFKVRIYIFIREILNYIFK